MHVGKYARRQRLIAGAGETLEALNEKFNSSYKPRNLALKEKRPAEC